MWYTASMNKVTVTFIWDEELKIFSAYLPDVPVCGEGHTKEAALNHLKEGIEFYIEEVGREEFLSRITVPMEHEEIELARLA